MSEFIFSNEPGIVGSMVSGGALPFSIIIGGDNDVPAFPTPEVAKAIITGFRVGRRAGVGLTHTLRDRIYAHVFGERAGRAIINGIAFAGFCNTDTKYVGFDAIHSYYETVSVSRTGAPVRLVFGPKTTLYGLMSDLEFTLEDASSGAGSFAFGFHIFPRTASAKLWQLVGGDNLLDPVLVADGEIPNEE